ncbi:MULTISPECIES: hypothetical protein [Sphingomonas]|uniref:hypothetical protein n=1 Tax=Sphingomonas TaxID=13687 RepID=UPI0024131BB5|nr:hypothetical protein [Sphingomonas echinoides]
MQTPYDAALRALDREMDALTQVISASASRLEQARTLHHALVEKISAEMRLAAGDCGLLADGYLLRARSDRDAHAADAESAEIELDLLRHRAARHYAAMRAVDSAAEQFRQDAQRADDRQQQALVDDIAAARFARMRRLQQTRQP